jgi:hypothetical protein
MMNITPSVSVESQPGKVVGDIQSNGSARWRPANAPPRYDLDQRVCFLPTSWTGSCDISSLQSERRDRGSGGNTSPDQDAQVNRIVDLNPRHSVSRGSEGAAASAIYGDGRRTAVIISTKRGQIGAR